MTVSAPGLLVQGCEFTCCCCCYKGGGTAGMEGKQGDSSYLSHAAGAIFLPCDIGAAICGIRKLQGLHCVSKLVNIQIPSVLAVQHFFCMLCFLFSKEELGVEIAGF